MATDDSACTGPGKERPQLSRIVGRLELKIISRPMNANFLIALFLGLLAGISPAKDSNASPGPVKAEIVEVLNPQKGELEWRFKGRTVLVYAFATNQFKPYVRELYTLRGQNVLRDAPADHLHHHGLMYAIRINGTNFWEEKPNPGIEKSVKLLAHKTGESTRGLPEASFTQLIHWLPPLHPPPEDSAAAALLIEERTLTLTVDDKNQEVAVRWDAAFQVGGNVGRVILHGSHYNGLGLRLPQSFDRVAKFENSEGQPYTGENTSNLIPARWTSASGIMDGGDVMLVLFGHPRNAGENKFFTLLEPFAYLSATQGLDTQPLEYSAGDKFALRYLLTVYPANQSRDFIQQHYKLWETGR
jgi:hypothetical protein